MYSNQYDIAILHSLKTYLAAYKRPNKRYWRYSEEKMEKNDLNFNQNHMAHLKIHIKVNGRDQVMRICKRVLEKVGSRNMHESMRK